MVNNLPSRQLLSGAELELSKIESNGASEDVVRPQATVAGPSKEKFISERNWVRNRLKYVQKENQKGKRKIQEGKNG